MKKLRELLEECLSETVFTCSRVWEAWSYGTMGEDDFAPAWEDEELIENIISTTFQNIFDADHLRTLDDRAGVVDSMGDLWQYLKSEDSWACAVPKTSVLSSSELFEHCSPLKVIHIP